jgi:hypothetical protein
MSQMQDDNPLTNPAGNLPGIETADAADGLYPNAVEQEYYEAGGTRSKGDPRPTDYKPIKPT